jgi:hypothetical protein
VAGAAVGRSKSFLPSFDGAIQDKRDRDEKKKLAAQGTKGPLKRQQQGSRRRRMSGSEEPKYK